MKRRQLLLTCLLLMSTILYAQDYTVQGIVTSADDGLPLIGANVNVKGTTVGTITDIDGNYMISVPKDGILVFSYIGNKAQERKITQSTTINIVLESDAQMLDEVVAIGYGTMKKSDLTGSVASISADQLKKTPAAGIDQALQGRAAGVTVNANSGQPGAGAEVRIRGIGTVNDSNPLYVVDGVILSDINFLSPNDIASTEILKDASSTAIYGSRGANGVILVTTKKGTKGRAEISYNTYVGWQNRWNKLDLMKRDELAQTQIDLKGVASEAKYFEKNGFNAWLSTYKFSTTNPKKPYYPLVKSDKTPNGFDFSSVETDWQDEVFNKNAVVQSHHIAIDGGSDKSSYSFSANYFSQDGTIIGSDYERFTIRANTSFQVNDWLKIGENLSFSTSQGRNAMNNSDSPGASILSAALAMAPWDPVYYPEGTVNHWGEDFSGRISTPTNFDNVTNPMSMVNNSHPSNKIERWVGDIYLEIKPFKDLLLRSDISYDVINNRDRLFKDAVTLSDYDKSVKNFISSSMARNASVIWENTLNYNKQFGIHNLSVMVGQTLEEMNYYSIGGSGYNILNPESLKWYLSQTTEKGMPGDEVSRSRRFSLLGRVHYSLKDRYLLTLNFRRDGSNKYPENTWGSFPSMALGWKVSEESWMKDISNLDFLKVRAGWGRIGNDKIGNNSFIQTINNNGPTFVDYVLGSNQQLASGSAVMTLINQGGIWELTETINLGVDFGLFNGLLSGNIDVFRRDTKEMVLSVKAPAFVGNRYDAQKNVGTVRNDGIEITLDHNNKIGKVNYSINGNVSFIKNELTALNGGNVQYIDGIRINDEGYGLYTFYGYEYQGIYKSEDEIKQHLFGYVNDDCPYNVGDAKFADLDGNGKIDDSDRKDIGNPFPWLTYGLNLGLEWNGFDAQIFFQGVHGNEIYNAVRLRTEGRGVESNLSTSMRNAWSKNNPDGTIPNPNNSVNRYVSSRFVEDGSYLRLKNLQIGYTLPRNLTTKVGINRCRFYVSASNLFTITDYTGYDPEVNTGVDYGNYPQARTVMVGLNLNF